MIETTPSLGFTEAINAAASKIFQIKGRSRRSEFWWTHMIVYLLSTALTPVPIFGGILNLLVIPLKIRRLHDTGRSAWWWGIGALIKISFVVYILYSSAKLALNGYEFEDYDSFVFEYIVLKGILFIGAIAIYDVFLLILCCIDSDKGENKYGPSPKYIDKEIV
ncbi:MAG: DUF805 domain-containing protein [Muribaculaceae bacterium]|nr:DUF805 domain-containing protein [Muribaculaceae bacterium]